jgi:hypothetical protein
VTECRHHISIDPTDGFGLWPNIQCGFGLWPNEVRHSPTTENLSPAQPDLPAAPASIHRTAVPPSTDRIVGDERGAVRQEHRLGLAGFAHASIISASALAILGLSRTACPSRVWIGPGDTVFIRTPSRLHSAAAARQRVPPLLAAAYGAVVDQSRSTRSEMLRSPHRLEHRTDLVLHAASFVMQWRTIAS